MNPSLPHLNYEFYFLCQVKYALWQEPAALSNGLTQTHLHTLSIDKDKRLFRYAPPPTETGELPPLSDWKKHLQQGWQHLQAAYQGCFEPHALMGVALLILDESITAAHQIQCQTTTGTAIFQPVTLKIPNEKILLTVTGTPLNNPVTLEAFEAELDEGPWQIQLPAIQLQPMQNGENYPNPVFAVYGLAHGVLPDAVADQLQQFLCSGQAALMWHILSRLLMQKWQFQRLDLAANILRQRLDAKNDTYQEVPDTQLDCASNKALELDLRDMIQQEAAAKQVLARLDAGTKTLEINRDNLLRQLQRSPQIWQHLDNLSIPHQYQWTLTWQNDTETPILDHFNLNIRQLQNHATYIRDALNYLDGIQTRWRLHLEGRRLRYESNIQNLLLVLTFIASFTGVVAFITQNPQEVAFLLQRITAHPEQVIQIGRLSLIVVNLFILIFFVLPLGYFYLKSLWKKWRCFISRRVGRAKRTEEQRG